MHPSLPAPPRSIASSALALHRELLARQSVLTRFAWLMLLLALPTFALLLLDERTLRDVAIWAKPLKFMLSTALFAACTAWFIGLLPAEQQRSRTVKLLAWTIVVTSVFEVGYITLQAARGQASHHNVADALHAALFGLMAVAAVALTATQAVLAWLIARHSSTRGDVATQAVVIGLALTFVLSTWSGFALGAVQPPAGTGLPLLGWHLGQPDARPAHFLGVHAQQFLPLLGWALQRWRLPGARTALFTGSALYVALWTLVMLAHH
jgi:hypothetical protein